jgi:hypothetical protein
MIKITIFLNEDDEEIKGMTIDEIYGNGICDMCRKTDRKEIFIIRLEDGNIWGICDECWKKIKKNF